MRNQKHTDSNRLDPARLSKLCCCLCLCCDNKKEWGRESTDTSTSHFNLTPPIVLWPSGSIWWYLCEMNPSPSHGTIELAGVWRQRKTVGFSVSSQTFGVESLGANLLSQPTSTGIRLGEPEQLGGWVHAIWTTLLLNKEMLSTSEAQALAWLQWWGILIRRLAGNYRIFVPPTFLLLCVAWVSINITPYDAPSVFIYTPWILFHVCFMQLAKSTRVSVLALNVVRKPVVSACVNHTASPDGGSRSRMTRIHVHSSSSNTPHLRPPTTPVSLLSRCSSEGKKPILSLHTLTLGGNIGNLTFSY